MEPDFAAWRTAANAYLARCSSLRFPALVLPIGSRRLFSGRLNFADDIIAVFVKAPVEGEAKRRSRAGDHSVHACSRPA
jgi:hypothetical protein